MSQELARNFQALKDKADPPPYFLSYEITQEDIYNVSASLGAIDSTGGGKSRTLDVSVRVGTRRNWTTTTACAEPAEAPRNSPSGSQITYEDNVNSIKHRLWEETDRAYRAAAERLIRIETNTQVKVAEQDASADFSSAPPEVSLAAPVKLKFDARNGPAAFASSPSGSRITPACSPARCRFPARPRRGTS
jgi:TldD protein